MSNTTQIILNEIDFLNKIEDLTYRKEQLQTLSSLINKNKFYLKKEIPAPFFWDSLDRCLNQAVNEIPNHEVRICLDSNKIFISNNEKEEIFEVLTPHQLRQLLSPEEFSNEHVQIINILLAHSTIFLSLNFILNID